MNEIEEKFEEWMEAEIEETDVDREVLLRAFIAGKNLAEEQFHYGSLDEPGF